MLISVKKKFVFIANSKTASTSIENALTKFAEINRNGGAQRKHVKWLKVKREYKFLFNLKKYRPESFFRFGVVREPIEWVLSWYNYRRGNKKVQHTLPFNTTFEQFWAKDEWLKNASQKHHFTDNDGICRFDLIMPQHEIKTMFPIVMKSLGLAQVKLPISNKSIGKKVKRSDLSSEIIAEINAYYREDFEFWQYWNEHAPKVLEKM